MLCELALIKTDKRPINNLYMPHGGRNQEKMEFKLEAYKYITNYFLQSQVQNKILLGDFNIAYAAADLARPVQNKNNTMFTIKERNAFLYLLKSGFVDAYRLNNKLKTEYTWWPYAFKARKRNIGWRIDYVLLPISLIHKKHKIQILNDIMGSDHCPIMVDIDI